MQGRMICSSWTKSSKVLRFKDVTLLIFNAVFPLYTSPFNNFIRIMKPNSIEIFTRYLYQIQLTRSWYNFLETSEIIPSYKEKQIVSMTIIKEVKRTFQITLSYGFYCIVIIIKFHLITTHMTFIQIQQYPLTVLSLPVEEI